MLSLKAKDQVDNAFMDDVDALIEDIRFVDDFDYGGKRDAVVALKVDFRVYDPEEGWADEVFVQHYTVGDKLIVADDGEGLDVAPGSKSTGLGKSTNGGKFIRSAIDSGFDEESLGEAISVLKGLFVHLNNEPQKRKDKQTGTEKSTNLLLISAIHDEVPAKGKPKAPAKAGKAAPAAAAPATKAVPAKGKPGKVDIKVKTAEAIVAVVKANGGTVALGKLGSLLFKANRQDPDVSAMTELAGDEDFLAESDLFNFDGTKVTVEE